MDKFPHQLGWMKPSGINHHLVDLSVQYHNKWQHQTFHNHWVCLFGWNHNPKKTRPSQKTKKKAPCVTTLDAFVFVLFLCSPFQRDTKGETGLCLLSECGQIATGMKPSQLRQGGGDQAAEPTEGLAAPWKWPAWPPGRLLASAASLVQGAQGVVPEAEPAVARGAPQLGAHVRAVAPNGVLGPDGASQARVRRAMGGLRT